MLITFPNDNFLNKITFNKCDTECHKFQVILKYFNCNLANMVKSTVIVSLLSLTACHVVLARRKYEFCHHLGKLNYIFTQDSNKAERNNNTNSNNFKYVNLRLIQKLYLIVIH